MDRLHIPRKTAGLAKEMGMLRTCWYSTKRAHWIMPKDCLMLIRQSSGHYKTADDFRFRLENCQDKIDMLIYRGKEGRDAWNERNN